MATVQISDENEVEHISSEKEKTSLLFLPSFTKSYSQTRIESTITDYTWKIDQFIYLLEVVGTLRSPPFPEKKQYSIQISTSHKADSQFSTINFHLHTDIAFVGSCNIIFETISHVSQVLLSKSISGYISNMTLLTEIPRDEFKISKYTCIIIHFKFEIFRKTINNTIHINLPSFTTAFLNNMKSEESILDDFQSVEEKSFKFIINKVQYVMSKKLLYTINSSYFKHIYLTYTEEKDMTNELKTHNEREGFQNLLSVIIGTQSIDSLQYYSLKNLLTVAYKYDVPTIKITCEHYLLRYITINNATEFIQLALSTNAKILELHLVTFIKFFMKEIMNTKESRDLTPESLNKIMELIEKKEIFENNIISICEYPIMSANI